MFRQTHLIADVWSLLVKTCVALFLWFPKLGHWVDQSHDSWRQRIHERLLGLLYVFFLPDFFRLVNIHPSEFHVRSGMAPCFKGYTAPAAYPEARMSKSFESHTAALAMLMSFTSFIYVQYLSQISSRFHTMSESWLCLVRAYPPVLIDGLLENTRGISQPVPSRFFRQLLLLKPSQKNRSWDEAHGVIEWQE